MTHARTATVDDGKLVADIAARGFYDDPVMSWVFPNATTRLAQLLVSFTALLDSFLPDAGTIHVLDDACTSLWRSPSYSYTDPSAPNSGSHGGASIPFSADIEQRFEVLRSTVTAAHPQLPHWYLNVLSTIPERQGQGLGARILEPVLATCDAAGIPAYLESSNARNVPFYQRQGFVLTGEIRVPGGPSLFPMWREARPPSQ